MPVHAGSRGRRGSPPFHARAALVAALVLALLPGAGASVSIGASPGIHDFGAVARGVSYLTSVTLRNGGDEALPFAVSFDGEYGPSLTASPSSGTITAGGSVPVSVTLAVPADAVAGRHEPGLVASGIFTGAGSGAVGAVRVPFVFTVAATDVAYMEALANDTVYVRIVNGHAAARDVAGTLETRRGGTVVESIAFATRTVGAQHSRHVYIALNETRYTDGTFDLAVSGTAAPVGGSAEAFTASDSLRLSAGVFTVGGTSGTGGGGGGGGGGHWPSPVPQEPDKGPAPVPTTPGVPPSQDGDGPAAEGGPSGGSTPAPGDGSRDGRSGAGRRVPEALEQPLELLRDMPPDAQRALLLLGIAALSAAAATAVVRLRPRAP